MERTGTPPHAPDYRADVDGLRALAVLGVLAFHAFPRVLPGGFIGVDVFFVISGYLISGILFDSLRRERFSYVEFYIRRIRRIFPALLAVLMACLVGGWFLLLPDEYKQLGRQVAAGAGFAANVLFWSQAGYFDTDAAIKPLLHLWSLGIEEQFYLGWPLLLAVLYRRVRGHLGWVMGLLLAGSFVANVLYVDSHPSATFYLPLARFWELLSGALLAYGRMFRAEGSAAGLSAGWREGLGWCGLGLIVAGLVWIEPQRAYPGWWALLPVLGTVLLILGRTGWVNRVVLSNRVMVFVGLISYPLYLWHWVLLAILRMRLYADGAEAPRWERLVALGASGLLAWGTYELIEKPIRFGSRARWKPVMLLGVMGAVALGGVAVDASDGAAFRYPPAIRPLAAYQYDRERDRYSAVLTGRHCFIDPSNAAAVHIGDECIDRPDGSRQLVALWGDSHAASLYFGLRHLQEQRGGFRIAQLTMGGCPPLLGQDPASRPQCRAFNDAAIERIRELHPDTVVLEGDWMFYRSGGGLNDVLVALRASIARLQAFGVRRIVVFGNLPVWNIAEPKIGVKLWLETRALPERTYRYFNEESTRADAEVRAAVGTSGAVFISPIETLCDARGCLLTTDPDHWTPLAWDDAHLTREGSTYLLDRSAAQLLGR